MGGAVLDVACGRGRHLRWFAQRGHPVTGVDRDPEAVAAIEGVGRAVLADIESGPWPFAGERFAGVVVGARVPIILTSRADNVRTRMASCAVAALFAHHLAQTRPVTA